MKRSFLPLLLLAACLGLVACGGESEQDTAKTQVCDARADIQKQINELRGLTPTTATTEGVTSNLQAIKKDLGTIKDAQGDLDDQRKQQVQAANEAFESQVKTIAASIGSSVSISQARSQLDNGVNQLADSYRQTLGRIDCG